MSELKHTPGPWQIGKKYTAIVYMNEYFRCEQTATAERLPNGMTTDRLIMEGDANAQLIAAAPTMWNIIKRLNTIARTGYGMDLLQFSKDINPLLREIEDIHYNLTGEEYSDIFTTK